MAEVGVGARATVDSYLFLTGIKEFRKTADKSQVEIRMRDSDEPGHKAALEFYVLTCDARV